MTGVNQNFGQIIKTLRTKSAANPALIFAAICLGGGLPGTILTEAPFSYIFCGIAALGVLLCALQIAFFTLFDRNRLHDEEHIENKLLIGAITARLGDSKHEIEISAQPNLTGNPSLSLGDK